MEPFTAYLYNVYIFLQNTRIISSDLLLNNGVVVCTFPLCKLVITVVG